MTEGLVFDIQHFCLDDGPGIRTTVFFKGCPLRCIWCHNAEGLTINPQIYFSREKCFGCGLCAEVCPQNGHSFHDHVHEVDFEACIRCGACTRVCRNEAVRVAGRCMTDEAVLKEVMKDKPFYDQSGGGITLSGGEPLMQGEFACGLAAFCKDNGLHVCVETSGYCNKETLLRILPYVDLFLFDYKHYDPEKHKVYTGVDNQRILDNLHMISDAGKSIILRCPIIPSCNDTETHYQAIAKVANELHGIREIHIEPYHPFGLSKYRSIGREATYLNEELMSRAETEQIKDYISDLTVKKVLIS